MKSVALQSKLTTVLLKSLTILLFFAFNVSSYSQDMDEARQKEGRKLFRSLCASCHKLDKKLVGPALGKCRSSGSIFVCNFCHERISTINR
jgi:cytochrome c2